MSISIEPYERAREPAVESFNQRLLDGGVSEYKFFTACRSTWLPPAPDQTLFEEYFLAIDGEKVRGGYALKHQPYWTKARPIDMGCLYLPLSEGMVDIRYGKVGLQLVMDALRRRPMLYALGMGAMDRRLPTLLRQLGWQLYTVPFFFRVARAASFLRNLTYAKRVPGGRFAIQLLAASRVGTLGVGLYNALRTRKPHASAELSCQLVHKFGADADQIWQRAHSNYSLTAFRDSQSLNRLYQFPVQKFLRILVSRRDKVVGWCVALDTQMSGHKQFGNARLGSIVDCFSLPGSEHDVVHAATIILEQRGVDLIVTNQAHEDWCLGLRGAGWIRGPSNYIFAASPKLAALLSPFQENAFRFHITRGDGEGPSHL